MKARLTTVVVGALLFFRPPLSASAQPSLTVDRDVVAPGTAASATVVGEPGQYFALVGSSVGGGFTHAGVALSVGGDVVILGTGVLDGTGRAVLGVVPPFLFSVLDRYYLQAAVSWSPAFSSIEVTQGRGSPGLHRRGARMGPPQLRQEFEHTIRAFEAPAARLGGLRSTGS